MTRTEEHRRTEGVLGGIALTLTITGGLDLVNEDWTAGFVLLGCSLALWLLATAVGAMADSTGCED